MMMCKWSRKSLARLAFVLLIAASVTPLVVQILRSDSGPCIEIVDTTGVSRTISLSAMKTMPVLTRKGSYQNQYGNWHDESDYSGVLLMDLIGDIAYVSIDAVADDGYRMTIERSRVEDAGYPMILAYRMDDTEVPDWKDGFCIAVLPEDGGVSNAEYGVESAGSYWVKRVFQLILKP